MIKKLLLSVLCAGLAFCLVAIKGKGLQKTQRVLIGQKPAQSAKTKTIKTVFPSGGELACALLSCPAVLSITE